MSDYNWFINTFSKLKIIKFENVVDLVLPDYGGRLSPYNFFARKFLTFIFFLKILPLKDDEVVMSEVKKTSWREYARKNT